MFTFESGVKELKLAVGHYLLDYIFYGTVRSCKTCLPSFFLLLKLITCIRYVQRLSKEWLKQLFDLFLSLSEILGLKFQIVPKIL